MPDPKSDSRPDDSPRDAAARWFARERSGAMSAEEAAAFADWRRTSPENDREFQALLRIWEAARAIPEARLLALADNPDRAPRRAFLPALAGVAACALVMGIAVAGWQWRQAQPVFVAGAETIVGERKSLTLPDGSVVDLNTRSQVRVTYFRDRRTVDLADGEALFSVKGDVARPFLVHAGSTTVRVTGTRFNVRRNGEAVAIAVVSGTVEVSQAGGVSPVALTAGQGVEAAGVDHVTQPNSVDVTAVTAWRDGRLVFDDAPLAKVAEEASRYRRQPIRVADEAIANLRLSSTFSATDTDTLLAALPKILPVAVRSLPDGSVEIGHP